MACRPGPAAPRRNADLGIQAAISSPSPRLSASRSSVVSCSTAQGRSKGSFLHSFTLPALAIVLGISMWMQQKLNPAPADPAQKMIFAWMPWIFMLMLGGFASGLVLYWITNNTITIGQQYAIMSMHGHPPRLFGNIRDSLRPRKSK